MFYYIIFATMMMMEIMIMMMMEIMIIKRCGQVGYGEEGRKIIQGRRERERETGREVHGG